MKRNCHKSYNIINKISRFQDRSTSISIILINIPDLLCQSLAPHSTILHHVSLPQVPIRFQQAPSGFRPSNQHHGLLAALLLGPNRLAPGWHLVGIWCSSGVTPRHPRNRFLLFGLSRGLLAGLLVCSGLPSNFDSTETKQPNIAGEDIFLQNPQVKSHDFIKFWGKFVK